MSKLPFSLIATVHPLSRDPTAIADPYRELKELLLRSNGLSDEQRTSKWLDYPMCSRDTRPSVLWDNLTALQPATLKEAQIALFLRKLPRHISAPTSRRQEPRRPAGYTLPQSNQQNRAGNRFPLARRQGFLHAPPPFLDLTAARPACNRQAPTRLDL